MISPLFPRGNDFCPFPSPSRGCTQANRKTHYIPCNNISKTNAVRRFDGTIIIIKAK